MKRDREWSDFVDLVDATGVTVAELREAVKRATMERLKAARKERLRAKKAYVSKVLAEKLPEGK